MRVPLLFGVILLVSLVSMHADRRARSAGPGELGFARGMVLDVAVPLQKMIAAPVDLVRDTWQQYVALVDVQHENDSLRAQLSALREENLQYREALVASGRLQRIVEMRDGFETPMLPMEVVGQDISPWFRSVLLDRGHANGLRAGMPVITDSGVVGLVTATSENAGRTMLLVDRQSAIDGIVQRSRVRGIVRGRGGDRLEFEFVVGGADVAVGDEVISSGLDGVYPKGLSVGRVEELVASPYGLTQHAILEPAVDFGQLEQVFVMLWRAPTMELLYDDAAAPAPGS
ncbi:MAG: rod shape-determining protein MreC [Deltaproteobacteria bacterium]|nr:rod shape-determining protein MreC [Deltaproteobacteria bacterium]